MNEYAVCKRHLSVVPKQAYLINQTAIADFSSTKPTGDHVREADLSEILTTRMRYQANDLSATGVEQVLFDQPTIVCGIEPRTMNCVSRDRRYRCPSNGCSLCKISGSYCEGEAWSES